MAYDLGDPVPLGITTANAAGVAEDAGTVTLTIGLPDGTEESPAVDHDPGTGVYTVDYLAGQVGRHTVRWLATGANSSAYVDQFDVYPAVSDAVVSLSQAVRKIKLAAPSADNLEDLREYMAAATAVIERHRNEVVCRREITEHLRVPYGQAMILTHTPVISLDSLSTLDSVTTYTVGDLHVDSNTGIVRPITGLRPWGDLLVTYQAGRTVVPAHYRRAALIIIEHLWMTERPMDTGARQGGWDDAVPVPGMGFAVPKRALELLGSSPPLVA